MTLPHADIDIEMLSTLVIEMNILRRHVTAYPAGHPVTRDAAVKVASLLNRLLAGTESVTLGIARDTILFGDHPLDRRNPVYRDFARALSDRGVVALTCHRHLDADELLRFGALLSRSRDEIGAGGGIEAVARAEGLTRLEVRGVNYDLFRVTEEEELTGQPEGGSGSASLWEQFVRGLLDGTIDPLGDATAKRPPLDPLLLAQVLNGHAFGDQRGPDTAYDAVIASFMRRMDRDSDGEQTARECAERFGTLVESLTPERRHQFLGKAFTSLAERPDAARRLVASVDDGIILDTIADLNDRNVAIPPIILNLCRKLGASQNDSAPPLSRTEALRVGHRLGTVLREGNFDQYIPDAYQGNLEQIVAAGKIASGLAESGDLKALLQGENHEAKVGAIILEVLESDPEGETFGMEESLGELCAYYLDAGDFTALRAVCDHLPSPGEAPSTPLQQRLLTSIATPSFTTPLMAAPVVWGKERYDDIRAVITRIGFPCVAPLLDRLAEEESMSLRRYYVACLLSLGQAAYGEVVARLDDGRWFYVRNLVAILRGLNDPAAIHPLHRLLNHPHPRVRQETLRTLVHFRDPEGERMLLRELGSGNRETLLTAIQLADRSRSPRVRERLLVLLHKGGITGPDFDVRCAVVRALAETGDPAVLPDLARILRSRSILRTASVTRLKVEIARSLARYPATDALSLAREAAASGVPELEQAARQTLRTMTGRRP
ncbi:HEAT repeat domain-containing protein [Geobacter grbiciae]|uniref:HEAT repeat domain-containing protein n=1 Tax=Geobacter grbiciae TaxID=155042 RepID=UPI001C0332A4|nr:HEAT repeat domain-containing protein [Geobacter grbiciae]MBT1076957.1 HEAT repeat domain-containing protein [Geobacter grbiciae]